MKNRLSGFLSIEELGVSVSYNKDTYDGEVIKLDQFFKDSLDDLSPDLALKYYQAFTDFCISLHKLTDSKTPWSVGKTYLDSASNEVRIIADSGKANFNGNHYPLIGEIKIDENYYVIGYYSQSGESVVEGPESQPLTLVEKT